MLTTVELVTNELDHVGWMQGGEWGNQYMVSGLGQ